MAELENERLMTDEEFLAKLQEWVRKTRAEAVQLVTSGTKSGAKGLSANVTSEAWVTKKGKTQRMTAGAAMRFPRYGVFVHYGVGRGWARHGGQVVRMQRIHKGDKLYYEYLKRGYSKRDISKTGIPLDEGGKGRKPVDWLDKAVRDNFPEIAEAALEWAAGATLGEIKKAIAKMTISKSKKGLKA